jgi:hypothetical protein
MSRKQLSRALSLSAAAIGALCFVGWLLGLPVLTRLSSSWVTMKANTALCIIFTGIAAALVAEESCSKRRLCLARIFAVLVSAVGLLSLLEHLGGWDFGIDQALLKESQESAGRSFPGRMGPASALVFMCLGGAILLIDRRNRGGPWPGQVLVMVALALTLMIFLGYFYNVELPARLEKYFSIALHTVAAFVLLCAGLLFSRPEKGIMPVFLTDDAGGAMARRLLPAAILIPALAGWLFSMGREYAIYGRGVAVALLAAFIMLVFT